MVQRELSILGHKKDRKIGGVFDIVHKMMVVNEIRDNRESTKTDTKSSLIRLEDEALYCRLPAR